MVYLLGKHMNLMPGRKLLHQCHGITLGTASCR